MHISIVRRASLSRSFRLKNLHNASFSFKKMVTERSKLAYAHIVIIGGIIIGTSKTNNKQKHFWKKKKKKCDVGMMIDHDVAEKKV